MRQKWWGKSPSKHKKMKKSDIIEINIETFTMESTKGTDNDGHYREKTKLFAPWPLKTSSDGWLVSRKEVKNCSKRKIKKKKELA